MSSAWLHGSTCRPGRGGRSRRIAAGGCRSMASSALPPPVARRSSWVVVGVVVVRGGGSWVVVVGVRGRRSSRFVVGVVVVVVSVRRRRPSVGGRRRRRTLGLLGTPFAAWGGPAPWRPAGAGCASRGVGGGRPGGLFDLVVEAGERALGRPRAVCGRRTAVLGTWSEAPAVRPAGRAPAEKRCGVLLAARPRGPRRAPGRPGPARAGARRVLGMLIDRTQGARPGTRASPGGEDRGLGARHVVRGRGRHSALPRLEVEQQPRGARVRRRGAGPTEPRVEQPFAVVEGRRSRPPRASSPVIGAVRRAREGQGRRASCPTKQDAGGAGASRAQGRPSRVLST